MAKTKTPFLSLGARGTIAREITAQKRGSATLLRRKPTPAYRRTLPQLYQRWLYEDYIAWWNDLSPAEKQPWNAAGSRKHMLGIAAWLQDRLSTLPDIVGWWRLDEKDGATVRDSSKNANDGTVFGALPTTGVINGAYSFDRLDDYITFGVSPDFEVLTNFTIETFIRVQVDPGWSTPIKKGLIAGSWNISWMLYCDPTVFRFYAYKAGLAVLFQPSATYTHGKTHHVAGTFDGSTAIIYLDGIEANRTEGITQTILPFPAEPFNIGSRWANYFGNLLDNTIWYNRVLTPADILRHSLRRYPS